MTADIESLVLEHLRHIRGRVDQIAGDVTDLKHRMTSLEGAMALVKPPHPARGAPSRIMSGRSASARVDGRA
jgi:hypothetical protein